MRHNNMKAQKVIFI